MSGLFLEENTILVKALDEAPSSSTCSDRTQERARIQARVLASSRPVAAFYPCMQIDKIISTYFRFSENFRLCHCN